MMSSQGFQDLRNIMYVVSVAVCVSISMIVLLSCSFSHKACEQRKGDREQSQTQAVVMSQYINLITPQSSYMECAYVLLLFETMSVRDCPWCHVNEMLRYQSNSYLNKSVMRLSKHFMDQVSLQPLNSNLKTSGFSLCFFRPFLFLIYTLVAGKLANC